MAFLDDLKDKTIDIAQAGVAKSKQLMELAKLNMANAGEEDTIRKAYIEIGKLYYAERGMAPEAAYVSLCGKVNQAKHKIEENKIRIAEVKRQGDVHESDMTPVVFHEIPAEESFDDWDDGCCCCGGAEPPAEEPAPGAECHEEGE